MTEFTVIGLFLAGLCICLSLHYPILYALIFGFVLFFSFGLYRGRPVYSLVRASLESAKKVSTIIIVMFLIGALTASWRASGTIAYLVNYASGLISPSFCLLATFWLNAALSTLIGTSFGTAATMGVVTMTLCVSMGISPFWAGGAVLSGAFTGDRCSPVSTSAQLVCLVTSTELYKNLWLMLRTGWLPFVISSVIYFLVNHYSDTSEVAIKVTDLLAFEYCLSVWTLIPVAIMFVLVAMRMDIKITITAAILAAFFVAIFVQKHSSAEMLSALVLGFHARNAEVGRLMDGGGLISMVQVCLVISISCTYAGLFQETGLLNNIEQYLLRIKDCLGKQASIVFTAVVTAMVSCNQMLCVILTQQLCKNIEPNNQKMALSLEDSSIVIPPLVPWSIAGAVPVATVGAPTSCVFAALFLILLPLFLILRVSRIESLD